MSTGFNDIAVVEAAHEKALSQSGLTQKVYEYITSLGVSSAAEMTFTQKLKLSAIALKEQAVAWVNSPLGMATIAAAGIFLIAKGIQYLTTATDRAIEKFDELNSKYEETISEVQSLESELDTIQTQLDDLNNTDNPEFVDTEEITKLERSKELLEQQLALKRELASYEQKEAAKAAAKALTAQNMYLTGSSAYTADGYALPEIGYRDIIDETTEQINWLAYLEKSLEQAYTDLGNVEVGSNAYKRQESYIESLKEKIEDYSRAVAENKTEILDLYTALLDDNGNVIEGFEDIAERVRIVLDVGKTGVNDERSTTIEQTTGALQTLEETLEKLNEVADNGQSAISSLSDALSKLKSGSLTLSDVVDLMQEFPELAPYVDIEADDYGNLYTGLAEALRNIYEQTDADLQEITQMGTLSEESAIAVDKIRAAIKRLSEESLEDTAPKLDDFANALSKIESISSGFDMLGKIYSDVKDAESFDWSSILNNENFTEAFGGLGDAYNDFIRAVANSPNDIDACQNAFDNLASAYIRNSDVLDDVTEETKDATVAMLEQMGIANAASIVDAKLAYNKELLRIQTELGDDATYDSIVAMYQECEAGSLTQQILAQLAATKMLVNENGIKTADEIKQLEGLAKAANATKESLARVAEAKQLMTDYEGYKDAFLAAKAVGNYYDFQINLEKAQSAYSKAQELLNTPLEYEEVDFGKYIAEFTGDPSESKDRDNEETWFEKQLALHQHLVEMDQESTEDYLDWLDGAYKQAYKEGILDLDNFYQYEEEVYKGMQDLFKEHLNDVEHEISMRENYDGESGKIIALYEDLIADVEKEIANARAHGLDDTDDYIQELQSKWMDYSNYIKDTREEAIETAKDALDELIEYRIDMLKQDTDAEKDALDKKLDYLKEFYDKQKEMLQDQYDEEQYLEDQAEKRKAVSDIQSELAMLANDDSASAQKRKLELQEELSKAQKDLQDFEDENALNMALDALDNAYSEQESQIQAEMSALEDTINDPEALYNKALADIKNNTEGLYQEMLEYNRRYGTGNDEDVADTYEAAYKALLEYKEIYGKDYEGVTLANSTNYTPDTGSWDTEVISGTNLKNQASQNGTTTSTGVASKAETPNQENIQPSLSNGSSIQVKSSATHYGSKSGGAKMASFVPGGTYTVYRTSGDEVLIGRDGVYTGWINKSDIVGYASGTSNATAGLHRVNELGTEYVFESPSDGTRYRMFHGGEKVLNAKATNFLYDFATSGGVIISRMLEDIFNATRFSNIDRPLQPIQLYAGDINIEGNADKHTVSEIRRAQRNNLEFVLKELNKLNK